MVAEGGEDGCRGRIRGLQREENMVAEGAEEGCRVRRRGLRRDGEENRGLM